MAAEIPVEVVISGSPDDFADAFRRAFSTASDAAIRSLNKSLSNLGSKSKVGDALKGFNKSAETASSSINRLKDNLRAIQEQSAGVGANLGDAFDPRAIANVNVQLEEVARLQDQINNNAEALDDNDLKQLRLGLTSVRTQLLAADTAFKQSAQTQRQVDRDKAESARQTQRQQIVAAQTSAKQQDTIARTSAQLQVAAIQSASQRRVAIIRAASRAIETIERGLRNVFQATATVVGAAFRGLATVGSSAFASLRRQVTNTNTDIRNSYSSTFSNASSTIRNETRNQSNAIQNFSSNATSSLGAVGNAVGNLGTRMEGLSAKTAVLAGLLGVGVAKALSGGFRRATILEDSERALTKLTGSAETARTLLTEITDVVTGTPFALDQFADAGTQLLAFNVEAEKIPRILTAIGDAAAIRGGDSAQTIDTIVRSFGQITTTGRVSLTEINSIAEAGVPALQILGNAFGKTADAIRDDLSDGTVEATAAIDALTEGIINGTDGVNGATVAFGGLGKELGGTLKGSLANLGTAFDRAGANVIKAFTPAIVAGATAATAAVDLIGSAFVSLANAITNSPVFKLIAENIDALAPVLKSAQSSLKPVFDFISAGLVNLGTALGALAALRRIPGLFTAIGFAVQRLLTPFNLLIGAGVLIGGFFQKLIDGSPALQEAFRTLGAAVTPVFDLFRTIADSALSAFSSLIENIVTPAVEGLAEALTNFLVPVIESLASFIRVSVVPAFARFANFISQSVIPVIGTGLAAAVEVVKTAFSDLAQFVQVAFNIFARDDFIGSGGVGWLQEDGPIVRGLFFIREVAEDVVRSIRVAFNILANDDFIGSGGVSWLQEDGVFVEGLFRVREGFESLFSFLSGTFVPFIQNNLTPVLLTAGAALAALVITGNPFAALGAGLAAAAAAIAADEDLREALVGKVQDAVEGAREAIGNLFDSGVLGKIAVGALKVANTIGRVLGDAISDPRFVTAVAGIVGAAAAIAGSFVLGLADGILNNLDDLAALVAEALVKVFALAFRELASNPQLALAVTGIIAGGFILGKLALAARQTGATIAQGIQQGVVTAGAQAGGGTRGLINGLFGGPAAIQAQAVKVGQQISGTLARQIGSDTRLLTSLGRALPAGLSGGRVAGSTSQTLAQQTNDLKLLTGAVAEAKQELGGAAVEGVRLRTGLSQLGSGVVSRSLSQVRAGISDIGAALRANGRQVAAAAGAVAGGAYMASFAATALLEAENVGGQITGALGLAATGGAVFAATGSAPLAGAAVGIGVLAAALTAGSKRAAEFRERVDEYAQAIREANDAAEETEALENLFGQRIEQQSTEVIDALARAGFSYEEFVAAVESGRVEDVFGDISVRADALRGLIAADRAPTFIQQLADEGTGLSDIVRILGLLQTEQAAIEDGAERAAATQRLFGEETSRAAAAATTLAAKVRDAGAAEQIAADATQAFRDRLTELNEARLDTLREKVQEAKDGLDEARTAAGEALSAVEAFFRGGETGNLEEATNDAVIAVSGLADTITTDLANAGEVGGTELQARLSSSLKAVKDEAASVLAQGIEDGTVVDVASATSALQPLIDAASEAGGEGGNQALAALNEIIGSFALPEGTNLLEGAIDAQAIIDEAQTAFDNAESKLQVQIEADPLKFPDLVSGAKEEFDKIGKAGVDGLAEGLGDDGTATAAATKLANDALEAAAQALGVESPSTAFANIGVFSVEGYAEGIDGATSIATSAATAMGTAAANAVATGDTVSQFYRAGQQAVAGFVRGMNSSSASVINTARSIASRAVATFEAVFDVESPSKVTTKIGNEIIQGFIVGMEDDQPQFETAASRIANGAIDNLTRAGAEMAKAIGVGFAEQGNAFIGSVTGALDSALDAALTKAEGFKAVGQRIALGLFQQQGSGPLGQTGGGALAVGLQQAFFDIQGVASRFTEGFQSVVDRAGAFAFTFDQRFQAGRDNSSNFLERGLEVREYAQTLLEAGRAVDGVIFETKAWRDQLIGAAKAANASDAQILALVQTLGLSNTQLADWAKNVKATTDAAQKASEAERQRLALEEQYRKDQEAAAKIAEAASNRAEADAAAVNLPPPIFRDLVIQPVGGDPEAIALATANRVAFSIRR